MSDPKFVTSAGQPGLWRATIDTAALRDRLIEAQADLPWLYLESHRQAILTDLADYVSDPPNMPPDHWRAGRAFGMRYELRWHMIESLRLALELLIETDTPDRLPLPAIRWRASDWHGRLDPMATPRDMPVIDPPGGRLRALDYRDRQYGAVIMTRLCEWMRK